MVVMKRFRVYQVRTGTTVVMFVGGWKKLELELELK